MLIIHVCPVLEAQSLFIYNYRRKIRLSPVEMCRQGNQSDGNMVTSKIEKTSEIITNFSTLNKKPRKRERIVFQRHGMRPKQE